MSDIRSILGNRFEFTYIVVIFLITVPILVSETVLGQNTTVSNNVNKTIVDDYDYYGQPIYYDEDNDNSDGGDNYYYTDDVGNNYYINAQGHHYWYDNDGHKDYNVDNIHNQKFHYDDNGNKVIHDNRRDSRTAYDNHSSGTHSHYAIYNTGYHVQPSSSGTYVHRTGVAHEHHGGGFSPHNGGGEHGGFEGRR